jgi:hypothetical protein
LVAVDSKKNIKTVKVTGTINGLKRGRPKTSVLLLVNEDNLGNRDIKSNAV